MGKKRKTKEQKLRAQLRRLEKKLKEQRQKEKSEEKIKREKKKKGPEELKTSTKEKGVSYAPKYLIADLRKTFFLTLLAIGFELVVYWFLEIR